MITVPYSVKIDFIDQLDPEYKEEHLNWIKDKANFHHEDTFVKIVNDRKNREELQTFFDDSQKVK